MHAYGRWIVTCSVLATCMAACAGTGATTRTTYRNDDLDIASFKTIAFGGSGRLPNGYDRGQLPEELLPIATEVFRAKMAEKGYQVVDSIDEADVVLLGGIGTREDRVRDPVTPASEVNFLVEPPRFEVQRGAIAIELFSREDGVQVWGGVLEGVRRDGPVDPDKFRTALADLFDRMPGPAGG